MAVAKKGVKGPLSILLKKFKKALFSMYISKRVVLRIGLGIGHAFGLM
jgi:hypothetical protein